MNKAYKVIRNIWHQGKMLYKNSRLILSEDDAEEYLKVGAIEEISFNEHWSGEYKMTRDPSCRGKRRKEVKENDK
jgi:hypothetical protein